MLSSFLITLRETLEAALIIGIILSYLVRTKQTKYTTFVYLGVISGIVVSIIGALLFTILAGGFYGRAEKIFEGITMLVGALLLTTLILWMMKQKHSVRELEHKVGIELSAGHRFGLFLLVFVSVLREGIETVIFLGAASFASTNNNIIDALTGIMLAIFLGAALFVGSMKINIKKFFSTTNILLILFAAGLVAHGISELQAAKIIPTGIEHLWDINSIIDEKGPIGSMLKGLFGYNGNPSLIEVLGYAIYLTFVFVLGRKTERAHRVKVS